MSVISLVINDGLVSIYYLSSSPSVVAKLLLRWQVNFAAAAGLWLFFLAGLTFFCV